MDECLKTVMELSGDPMLALEEGRIVYVNEAAKAAFSRAEEGKKALWFLPEQICDEPSPRFSVFAEVDGIDCQVSCIETGSLRFLSLRPKAQGADRGICSDGLITSLLNQIFTIGLSISQLSAHAERSGDRKTHELMLALRHSYYSLKRQITNLQMAVTLREPNPFLRFRFTDLVVLCDDLVNSVNGLTGDKYARIVFSSPLARLDLAVDTRLVQLLLLNLLSNSLTHTPASGEIRVGVTKSGDNAVLSVDDNGAGIRQEVLRNVFSRFESPIDPRHLERGLSAGLGLTVAGGIARVHGGTIMIESREGKGTSVRATLPIKRELTVEGGDPMPVNGMDDILMVLADFLDSAVYAPKYFD